MNYVILKSLLFDITLIIALIYITGRFRPSNERPKSKVIAIFYSSVIASVLSILCTAFPVIRSQNFVFDLGAVTILAFGMIQGFFPAMIPFAVVSLYRLYDGVGLIQYDIIFNTLIPALLGSIFYMIIKLYKKNMPVVNKINIWDIVIMGIALWAKDSIAYAFFLSGGAELYNQYSAYIFIADTAVLTITVLVTKDNYTLFLHHSRLREEVTTDELTKLKNYRYIINEAYKLTDNIKDKYKCLSVMMIDIDSFKKYNDTYGHMEGNKALKMVSSVLIDSTRDKDVVARYGGEEFLVILNDVSVKDAYRIAERIRKNIGRISINSVSIKKRITVSIGVSGYPEHGTDMSELIKKADTALYKAKKLGRDNVQVYSSPDNGQEYDMENSLPEIIDKR